jgi:hypothetical protein
LQRTRAKVLHYKSHEQELAKQESNLDRLIREMPAQEYKVLKTPVVLPTRVAAQVARAGPAGEENMENMENMEGGYIMTANVSCKA